MKPYYTLLAVILMVLICNTGWSKGITLKTQLLYNTTLPIYGESVPFFADKVEKASGGDVVFKLYEPGKLVPPLEILEAVSRGQIDAGGTSAGFWSGKLAAAPFFSAVPFGPEAPEYMAWMLQGNGLKLWQQMYDDAGFNVKVFPISLVSPETAGWYQKPINTPDDIKGLKIRFFGLGGQLMQKLGASVSQLPPGEIFPALEKGALDATEFSQPLLDKNLGFHKIAKYNYFPGWHQPASITELIINKDVWNEKLTDSQRTLIEMMSLATCLHIMAKSEAAQSPVLKENVEKHGVEIKYFSPEMIQTFRDTWKEVAAEQAEKDPFFKKVYEDLQQFRNQYETWLRVGFLPREVGPQSE